MTYHVLNGDALATGFPSASLPGEILITREALVTGDLHGSGLAEFWQTRAAYLQISLQEYKTNVASQFDKILAAPPYTEFNLWFEYDLFCQVNLWFLLSLINQRSVPETVYVVSSSFLQQGDTDFWNGFGGATSDQLEQAFRQRIRLAKDDLALGTKLWEAYKKNDLVELKRLSSLTSTAFPWLAEVVDAHIDRFPADGKKGRPELFMEEIVAKTKSFPEAFQAFKQKESIYGFGDTQVKELYDKVTQSE